MYQDVTIEPLYFTDPSILPEDIAQDLNRAVNGKCPICDKVYGNLTRHFEVGVDSYPAGIRLPEA